MLALRWQGSAFCQPVEMLALEETSRQRRNTESAYYLLVEMFAEVDQSYFPDWV